MIDSTFEDVPVHGTKNTKVGKSSTHQRNHSLDFRHVTPDGPRLGCGHQRNRSLDSVLQRIPEDITPTTSPEDAIVRFQSPSGVCSFQTNAGSDDSGIHALPDGFEKDEEPPPPVAARSRESLDSGNPEDADKLNSDEGEKPPDPPDTIDKPEKLSLPSTIPVYKGKDSLLRLFENKHFDMKMAITYLCKSNEPGVQSYLANKLFSYPPDEVDFYLPQLAIMFIEMGDMGEMLKPYLEKRCEQSAEFSLRLVWLLAAFGGNAKRASATEFRKSIIAEKIRPAPKRGHHRSQSDASALRLTTPTGKYLGDLASGRAFDNGCMCGVTCSCGAPRLAPQIQFLSALTNICRRLTGVTYKEGRNGILRAELAALDLNLPAKVWLPLHHKQHYVLRIPPHAAAVLNSSEKAPYIMYVEVLETEGHEPLPPRLLPPAPHSPPMRQSKSEENLVPDWPTAFLYNPNEGIDTAECWNYDDDEVAYFHSKPPTPDTVSQMSAFSALSLSSTGSRESVTAGEVRRKLTSATELSPNVFRHDPHDPSAMALKESWQDKHDRLRSSSPYGSLPGWCLLGCIVKVGDDLRQELLAVQLLRRLQTAWMDERLLLKLTPYEIICLDESCGFIQPILNTVSLHQIKKQSGATLRDWLHLEHGPDNSESFLQAQMNFIRSTAAYALVSYLLQLKDRHNGNILLDNEGHIIHIDFGFILSQTPKNLGFERSPFKLTQEFVDVMDGEDSDNFQYFKQLILQGLIAAKKHCEHVVHLVELMKMGGHLPCLRSSRAVSSFKSRFHLNKTDAELQKIVDRLVKDSMNSYSTRLYDKFQYYTNGIL